VELGRLDGLVSKAGDVAGRLPGPDMRVEDLAATFARHNLSARDMAAHTVGFAHCARFTDRLYYSHDPAYSRQLMEACPPDVGPDIADRGEDRRRQAWRDQKRLHRV
jgi:peroxidase